MELCNSIELNPMNTIMNLKKVTILTALVISGAFLNPNLARAQAPVSSNPPPTSASASLETNGPLSLLESFIANNDMNYNGWTNAHFTIWQAAAFANVNGVPGASSEGNDLGFEVPIHKYSLHLDSVTRFEQLFGDIGSQQVGLGYDYTLHQLQLSAGLDVRYT